MGSTQMKWCISWFRNIFVLWPKLYCDSIKVIWFSPLFLSSVWTYLWVSKFLHWGQFVLQVCPPAHGRTAVLDSHTRGNVEPFDVESGGIPAEDYTSSAQDFISPATMFIFLTWPFFPQHMSNVCSYARQLFQPGLICFQGPLRLEVLISPLEYEA